MTGVPGYVVDFTAASHRPVTRGFFMELSFGKGLVPVLCQWAL